MKINTLSRDQIRLGRIIKPGAKTVTIYLTAPTELAYTTENRALLLVLSDVLTAGAGKLDRNTFLRTQNELGAHINVGIADNSLLITLTSPRATIQSALKLLVLILTKPTLLESEIKRAKSTLANLLELEKDNARGLALANFKNSFSHPGDRFYTSTPHDLAKAIATIKKSNLTKLSSALLSQPVIITTGGDDTAVKLVERTLTKLFIKHSPTTEISKANIVMPQERQVVLASVPSKQNIELSIGSPLPLTSTSADLPAFLFGLAVLGKWGGFAGRLMSTVREKEGLTYTIYARAEGMTVTNQGFWRILTFFSPKDVSRGLTSTLREITNIHNKGITESEWNRFKTIIKTGEQLTYDSLSGTVGLVHSLLSQGQSWDDYSAFREALQSCTHSEVNQALKKYLNPNRLIISAAGPIKGLEKELKAFSK